MMLSVIEKAEMEKVGKVVVMFLSKRCQLL
jgi:hypothetical protein